MKWDATRPPVVLEQRLEGSADLSTSVWTPLLDANLTMQAKIKLTLRANKTCNLCMPARASEQRDASEAVGWHGPENSH